jgi:PAS domain S-box-containing protein
MREGVMIVDATGTVAVANEAAARIFGVSPGDLRIAVERYPKLFDLRDADGSPRPVPVGTRALGGEIVEPIERLIRTRDGVDKHLRTSAAPVRAPDGTIIGAVIVLADVTEEKAAQAQERQRAQELREAYEEAQRAVQDRDEVLSVVSHDLRNPLGAVSTAAGAILRVASDERIRRAALNAFRAAQHMRRLIEDLLTVTRARGGKLALDVGEHSPAGIVEDLVATFEPVAAEKGLALGLEGVPASRPIACDPVRVVEALSNFVGNAISATRRGGAIALRAEEAGGEVVFSVRDTGPGIAEADLGRIFERHYRAPGTTYEGTGLGLAIAKAIAEAHGGRVWAESRLGAGSTFFLALPADPESSRR